MREWPSATAEGRIPLGNLLDSRRSGGNCRPEAVRCKGSGLQAGKATEPTGRPATRHEEPNGIAVLAVAACPRWAPRHVSFKQDCGTSGAWYRCHAETDGPTRPSTTAPRPGKKRTGASRCRQDDCATGRPASADRTAEQPGLEPARRRWPSTATALTNCGRRRGLRQGVLAALARMPARLTRPAVTERSASPPL